MTEVVGSGFYLRVFLSGMHYCKDVLCKQATKWAQGSKLHPKFSWQQRARVMIKAMKLSQHHGHRRPIRARPAAQPHNAAPVVLHPVVPGLEGPWKLSVPTTQFGSDLHLVRQVTVINWLVGQKANITESAGLIWKPLDEPTAKHTLDFTPVRFFRSNFFKEFLQRIFFNYDLISSIASKILTPAWPTMQVNSIFQ